ncbi:28S ribosomal protein S15, mitochondrial [Colossoma macropomum]|uniref:28S ribosomal protein S15, mitochondrial n=1 Tax=Colossoma macropomum TaxID=42526 RepID=UPI001863E982|nr:28S ribosomal protein S15, mitochondrial [Colossoma macropomum]
MLLKNTLKSAAAVLRTWTAFSGSPYGSVTAGRPHTHLLTRSHSVRSHENFTSQSVRQYAQAVRKKQEFRSQLQDLSPSMLKPEYASVPLAHTVDDVVKKLLSLELASHSEKLHLKRKQLVAKVQRDENDHSSPEVKIAILTAQIRNFQEHLHKHPKDKANKRWMLMSIDQRNKMLKVLRRTHYDAFEKVCQELGISYTFPPEYYRRATRRWLAKKALCIKVFKEVQKQKAEQRNKIKQSLSQEKTETSSTSPPDDQGTAV